MTLELDHEYEGVGAHILNPRFDWIKEEHGERPQMYTVSSETHPALFAAQVFTASAAAVPFEGHDGSHYQWDAGVAARANPPVDLVALASVTKIIWWKATQSISYVDPSFARVWKQARALFGYRLAYHWLSSTTDPEQQAAHLCKILDSVGGPQEGDAIMIDSEENGVNVEKCDAFAVYCERYYDRPIISGYFGLYIDGGRLWNSEQIREGNYGHRPMHLAAYVLEERLNSLMRQRGAKPYDAWQYWSGGPVPGIFGRADMNTHVNFGAYDVICLKQPKPKPTPVVIVPDPPPPLQGEEMSVLDTPVRAWDSRPGSPQGGNGKHSVGETFFVNIAAKSPPPANARGVIVGLTVLDGEGPGFLAVWGQGGQPETSNVNFTTGEVKNSLAVVPLSGGGINTFTSARCNVIVDVQGWTT
jgi:GH25 family lysozyme M1 (1,4-beta-N-acetylmuramidase)